MAKWNVWIDDDLGNRIRQLPLTSGFKYQKVLNDDGFFEIRLPDTFNKDLIRRDAKIEFWRNGVLDFLGLIRGYRYRTDGAGITTLRIEGPSTNHLLVRRFIIYNAGTAQATASAIEADDLMKRIVSENLGSDATDSDRDWSGNGLSVGPDTTNGPTVSMTLAWKNVLKTLQKIADNSKQQGTDLYFGFELEDPKNFTFVTRTGQWGKDRTTISNSAILSLKNKNIEQPDLAVDWWDELTHVTGAGQQTGEARITTSVSDSTALNASAFNRIEGFKDARQETSTAGIQDVARAHMEKNRAHRRFRCQIVENKGFLYKSHFDFGDKMNWEYVGEHGTGVIRSIDVRVNGKNEETITARLETD